MNRKTVAVLFGGMSTEHDISLMSAATVIANLDTEKYYVLTIGITKEGKWLLYNGNVSNISSGEWERYATPAVFSPDATHGGIIKISGDKIKFIKIDVVFPVLHGKFGEDGTVQGLLELSKIPYVGCGVLASAVSMDKAYTKIIAKSIGLKQAKYLSFEKGNSIQAIKKEVTDKVGFPCFVKPANAGSSVGISKVKSAKELSSALDTAFKIDRTIVIEENIEGREMECAILGNYEPCASSVGEIIPAADFYDYDAKYNNSESKTIIPADIPAKTSKKIRDAAIKLFRAVGGTGLARIDFFLVGDDIYFNEINTVPGFTSISMYAMLWEHEGISNKQLLDKLISLALEVEV